METKTHVLSILMDNEPGVLLRVAGLFSRRGYNVESISAAETEDPKVFRMTIVTSGDEATLEQIDKQLSKLVDVREVKLLTGENSVRRQHVLIQAGNNEENRASLIQVANLFHANIVSVSEHSLILELTGKPPKIDAFIRLIEPFGILKMVRSGLSALERE
ncbi:MAG: acetolactate synthase small subunit [Massiliimalia sp.]